MILGYYCLSNIIEIMIQREYKLILKKYIYILFEKRVIFFKLDRITVALFFKLYRIFQIDYNCFNKIIIVRTLFSKLDKIARIDYNYFSRVN